jgi:hypothetical protein
MNILQVIRIMTNNREETSHIWCSGPLTKFRSRNSDAASANRRWSRRDLNNPYISLVRGTASLVYRLAYNSDVVAFKMGRRQGGPSRTGIRGRIPHHFTPPADLVLPRRCQNGAGRNRRATQPPAHFQRNPLGRGQLAVFPRCSLDPSRSTFCIPEILGL